MKRNSTFSKTSSKKVRFSDDNSRDNPIPELLPHHYHLGGENYVTVSDFTDQVRIHIRRYMRSDAGALIPTKVGVTLSPVSWEHLCKSMDSFNLRSATSSPVIVHGSLLLSSVKEDDSFQVTMQRYFVRKNLSRCFLPYVCILSESEWSKLETLRSEVSESITTLLFGRIFQNLILTEVKKQTPSNTSVSEQSDVEMVLTTSLIELLKSFLQEKIDSLFVCDGCIEYCDNQLGHDCINISYGLKLAQYENLAIFSLDFEHLAQTFVTKNMNISNYINFKFVCNLNMSSLLKNAKELYKASDPFALCLY